MSLLGGLYLGSSPIGTPGIPDDKELNLTKIQVAPLEVTYLKWFDFEIENTPGISIQPNDTDTFTESFAIITNEVSVSIQPQNDVELFAEMDWPVETSNIDLNSYIIQTWTAKNTPTIEQYINHIRTTNIRRPKWRMELLRKEDESVYDTLTDYVMNNSGSVSNVLNEGVRRTCSLSLANYNNQYTDFINGLSIGSKFRLSLGYEIDGVDKFFPQGTFVFDDPGLTGNYGDHQVIISGTDKWSMLNGQNGGILNGTYVITEGSKIGDLVRQTLALDIVGDPIEPSIHQDLENETITYDIVKNAGDTIADILLEAALNVSAYIYYDEHGRLQLFPVDNDMFKSSAYNYTKDEYNYLTGTKQYQLSQIYNAVLVIGENIKNSNTPIVYEAINNDLSDPNSVPNVGFKKVFKITEYTKGITTDELAEARGNWELKRVKAKLSSVDIESLPLYHLDVNQIVTLTDEYLKADGERFLINSIDLPIAVDALSVLNVVKAVEVE